MDRNQKVLENIILVQLPHQLTYYVGAKKIDPEGGQICAIFGDRSYQTINMDDPQVKVTFDSTTEGPAIATLSYMEKTSMFQLYIRQPVVRRMTVKQPPNKREYLAGETLDLQGMVLIAEYETGELREWTEIPELDYQVKEGDAVYLLSVADITVPIFFKVKKATLIGIEMGKMPDKTVYLERKETLSVTGGTVIYIYDSGVREEKPISIATVRGFSNLTAGQQTLTVQIGQHSTTFDINVIKKTAKKVIVVSPPVKVSYIEGEPIEMDGVKIRVEYDNEEVRICDNWEYKPQRASLAEPEILLTVDDACATIPIHVTPRQIAGIEVYKMPDKLKYLEQRDDFEPAGAEIKVRFNNGTSELLPVTPDMVCGFDNRISGECDVEVKYGGFFAAMKVEIIPQQLMGILITEPPDRVQYAPGEVVDISGIVVMGFYNGGMVQRISSYAVSPDHPLRPEDVAIVITVMDKTAIVPIEVSEKYRSVISESANRYGGAANPLDIKVPMEWHVPDEENPDEGGIEPAQDTDPESVRKRGKLWASKIFSPPGSRFRKQHE